MNKSLTTLLTAGLIHICHAVPVHGLVPAGSFEDPVPLLANGVPINLGNHAAPRLADWDGDGDQDLLVGAGDGYVWLFTNTGSAPAPVFAAGVRVRDGLANLRHTTGYTGACFADMNGDGLPDLVTAGDDNRARLYTNRGLLGAPSFSGYSTLLGTVSVLALPSGTRGRIDVADWDGDGLLDLVTGEFDGYINWFRNTGTAAAPRFATAQRLRHDGSEIHWPYNTHPRVYDLNGDGILDLTFGINWGNFGFLINTVGPGATNLPTHFVPLNTNGTEANIRSIIGDDTIPDYGDFNGDGVLDIVSGGINGRLFVLNGVPYSRTLDRIEQIMQGNSNALGRVLGTNAALRQELFGLHHNIRDLLGGLLSGPETRLAIRDWYAGHITRYPQFLRKQFLNTTTNIYVPSLAGQIWVNLLESQTDSADHRQFVADNVGLTGRHRDILQEFGTLFIENSRADTNQLEVVFRYLASIPRGLWDAEKITISDFLGSNLPSEVGIKSRTGVNIFSFRVGQFTENSFPRDSTAGIVDTFSVALAHEINHTVDAHTFGLNRTLLDRKHTLIEQAAPTNVIFLTHSNGLGVDWRATQTRFRGLGYWNGSNDTWQASWDAYWQTGPGRTFETNTWLRNNLQLMCEAPQEAFATLANQYFTDSNIMLDLAWRRWRRGVTNCVNQFLFFIEVYAEGGDSVPLYKIDAAGRLTRTVVPLRRDELGRVVGITMGSAEHEFSLTARGDVSSWIPRVPLRIAKSGRDLRLSWPTGIPGLILYGSTNLQAGSSWTPVTFGPVLSGNEYIWFVSPSLPNRFYRLQ